MSTIRVSSEDVEAIFEAWRGRQKRPHLCRLTEDRKDLIRKRLRLGYSVQDFLALIEYAYKSNDPGPRWWRGENPNSRTYLDLDNLFRKGALASRIEAALNWKEDGSSTAEEADDNFGPFRLISGGKS